MPVKPLTFKGDKKSKKRKHQSTRDPEEAPSKDLTQRSEPGDDGDDTWVGAELPTDLVGPVILMLPTDTPSCLSCDPNGKVFSSELENLVEGDPSTAEPHDVRQVWVASRVTGSEHTSFKGHHGRYLSCDKFGILSASREAISPEESFVCISSPDIPGTFSLQTMRDTFLTIKEGPIKGVEVRGDAETINFNSTFRIRMQARFKPKLKASKEVKALEKISRKELEEVVGRRLEDDEVKRLKRARREGNYHEEILDVRVKGKHDKFAS